MSNRKTNLKVRDPEREREEEEIHGLAKALDSREIWISGKQTLVAHSERYKWWDASCVFVYSSKSDPFLLFV